MPRITRAEKVPNPGASGGSDPNRLAGGWGQGDMLTTSFNIQIKKQTKKRVLKMQKDSKKAENNTSLPLPLKGSLKHLIGASLVVQ